MKKVRDGLSIWRFYNLNNLIELIRICITGCQPVAESKTGCQPVAESKTGCQPVAESKTGCQPVADFLNKINTTDNSLAVRFYFIPK